MEYLDPSDDQWGTWAEDVTTYWCIPEFPELLAAVTVTCNLAERPDCATVDDDTLLDLTASRWSAKDVNWSFDDMWRVARASTRTSEARERARWAPWWRAASLWPEEPNLTVFACVMQYLWQHRSEYEQPAADPERPWLLESGKPPEFVLLTVLTEVLGPDPTRWPWPYSWWTVDTDLASWTSLSNDPSEPDWLEMTGLTDEELDHHLLRTVGDA